MVVHPQGTLLAPAIASRSPESSADTKAYVNAVLDGLVEASLIERWWQTVYEPESAAFGGPEAMDVAHALFHADSRYILNHALHAAAVNEAPLGRRELSILLCSKLLRGAGQDFYEQGDVWHRVAQLRPLLPEAPTEQLQEMTNDLRLLMTADLTPPVRSSARTDRCRTPLAG